MSELFASNCPRCGAQILINKWTESRPWGSTTAQEPMADVHEQECDCDLTEDEWDEVFGNVDPEPYDPRY